MSLFGNNREGPSKLCRRNVIIKTDRVVYGRFHYDSQLLTPPCIHTHCHGTLQFLPLEAEHICHSDDSELSYVSCFGHKNVGRCHMIRDLKCSSKVGLGPFTFPIALGSLLISE